MGVVADAGGQGDLGLQAKAQGAADGIAQIGRLVGSTPMKLLGVPEVQKLETKVEKNDAQFSFALDDRAMRQLLVMTPKVVGQ